MKSMIGYSHMMEFLPGKTSEYSGYLFFCENFVPVISTLLLIYYTSSVDIFIYTGFGINLFGLIVFAFIYIPESTKFLMEKGKRDRVKQDLDYILRVNRATSKDRTDVENMFNKLYHKSNPLSQSYLSG